MRRSASAILSLALMTAALPSSTRAAEGLCTAGETTVFSCRMSPKPGARTAALCSDENAKPRQLHYRFGTPGHVELAYPAAAEHADFRHAIISYSGSGGDAVLFTHGGAIYALFYVLGHDLEFDGVTIRRGDTEVANLSCAAGSVDNLTTDFFKAAGLPQEDGQFSVPEVFFDRYAQKRR